MGGGWCRLECRNQDRCTSLCRSQPRASALDAKSQPASLTGEGLAPCDSTWAGEEPGLGVGRASRQHTGVSSVKHARCWLCCCC